MDPVALLEECRKLEARINSPITATFLDGVQIEAAHQIGRWGPAHDRGKTPFDWFWLVGYLAQKAATASVSGDIEKALHHTISTAAALLSWHAYMLDGPPTRKLSGSEALFGFIAWLTTNGKNYSIGPDKDCAVWPPLIREFCETNGLDDPSHDWAEYLTHPT